MFKNALVFRLDPWSPPSLEALEHRLQSQRFVPCGASQMESAGWVEPRGEAHAPLLEVVGGQWLLRLVSERKAVPASVVKQELELVLDKLEAETGRRPKGKAAKALKDDVVLALLPRAFPRRSSLWIWIDPQAALAVVGTGSTKLADTIGTRLVELMGGGVRATLVQTQRSPATAMSAWLQDQEPPAGFTIDRECELKQPDGEKAVVRYARHTLEIDEVGEHIRQGKQPTRVAMTWQGRVSFVLTETLALKKIELLDVVLEGAGRSAAPEDNGFDADAAIATGELGPMIVDLVQALGGELSLGMAAAPSTAATSPAAPATPSAPAPTSAAASASTPAPTSAPTPAAADDTPPWDLPAPPLAA